MRKLNRLEILASLAATALTGVGLYIAFSSDPKPLSLLADDAAVVSRGQVVYAKECASCHGENLEGQPNWQEQMENGKLPAPPHDETGHTWHHDDQTLIDLTKRGPAAIVGNDYKTDMPGFGDRLSDHEIVAALSFIKSRWPEEIRKRQDMRNANSQAARE